jgi:hypothetical protein
MRVKWRNIDIRNYGAKEYMWAKEGRSKRRLEEVT